MLATPATLEQCRGPTHSTAYGETARNFSPAEKPSLAFSVESDKELDYRLIKELWVFHQARIAVRFAYEWHDASGNWFRSYGNENWEFDGNGLMRRRIASINDLSIRESERKCDWPLGPRPNDYPSLSDLGL